MNVNQFGEVFNRDAALRTQFAAVLAQRLKEQGITGSDVSIKFQGNDGDLLSTLVVGAESNDALMQLRVADAAIKAMKDSGVTDLSEIKPIKPGIDPAGWNVVYKDGGWVINGMAGGGVVGLGGGLGGGARGG